MMALDANKILLDVPRMRRYAALMFSNDRESGDDIVEQALQDLVASPDVLHGQDNLRPHLFRALHLRLAKACADAADRSDAKLEVKQTDRDRMTAEAAFAEDVLAFLAEMPMEQRAALLLVVVEELAYEHVGYVLGTTTAIVKALLDDARSNLQLEAAETSKTA